LSGQFESLSLNSHIKEYSAGNLLPPYDYLFFYKINYKYLTSSKKYEVIAESILVAMLTGGNAGYDLSRLLSDSIELQFILLDYKNKKVISFGHFIEQEKDFSKSIKNSSSRMVDFIFYRI
jgi:hypothetical protein